LDSISWAQLWHDEELRFHIRRKVRSLIPPDGDRPNAEAEAYALLCRLPPGQSMAYYVKAARNPIRAARRAYRRQRGLPPDDD
jgi:hypothetical protein